MIDLMLVATAKCDSKDTRCDTSAERFSLPVSQALTFTTTAYDFFVSRGWDIVQIGKTQKVFCPVCRARRMKQ